MGNITFWRYQIIDKGTMETPFYGVHEVYIDEKTKSDLEKILSD